MGLIDGVLSTLPGFLERGEVVEVEFDPGVISFEKLVKKAKEAGCAVRVFTRTDGQHRIAEKIAGSSAVRSNGKVKPDKEPKYYLLQTKLRFVPMTGLQAARVNGRINEGDHEQFLSPRQLDLLKTIEAHPEAGWKNAIGRDPAAAWSDVERIERKIEGGQ